MNLTMIQHARQVPTLENQQYNEGNCLFFFTSLSKPMFVQISHGYSSLLKLNIQQDWLGNKVQTEGNNTIICHTMLTWERTKQRHLQRS